jgi:hypothetical protein
MIRVAAAVIYLQLSHVCMQEMDVSSQPAPAMAEVHFAVIKASIIPQQAASVIPAGLDQTVRHQIVSPPFRVTLKGRHVTRQVD